MENLNPVLRNTILALLLGLLSSGGHLQGGSGTWKSSPGSGDWNTTSNWSSGTIPLSSTDTATFAVSNITAVSLSGSNTVTVGRIVFNAGASGYTITASPGTTLAISGTGITNSSGGNQGFVAAGAAVTGSFGGTIKFNNNSSAGNGIFTNSGGTTGSAGGGKIQFYNNSTASSGTFTGSGGTVSGASGSEMDFFDNSSAGNGSFTMNGGNVNGLRGGLTVFTGSASAANGIFTSKGGAVSGAIGGIVQFGSNSTAGSASFTNQGGAVSGANGSEMDFFVNSTAGSSTIIMNGGAVNGANGGNLFFLGSSTSGSSTLIANGGVAGSFGETINFQESSTGGTARVEVFGNGVLTISNRNSPSVTIGSLEGNGTVLLVGPYNLTVGSNGMNTLFSGVIQDYYAGLGLYGSLTKTGTGTLTLSGSNAYTTGTTNANGGTLAFGVSEKLSRLNVGTSGTAVLTAHSGGAANVKVLDLSALTISGVSFDLTGSELDGSDAGTRFFSPTPVPEPTTIVMTVVGGFGLLACRKRIRSAKK